MPFAALLLSAVLCLALGVLPARLAGRRPARRDLAAAGAVFAGVWAWAFLFFGKPGLLVDFGLFRLCAVCAAAAVPCVTAAMHRSILAVTMSALAALTVFLVVLEALIDVFLTGRFAPGWSLICAAVGVVMVATLLVVRLRPRLREEVRKRFHI